MYNLNLTDQHLAVLSTALGELPIRIGVEVWNEISRQVDAQRAAHAAATSDSDDGKLSSR